MNYLLLKIVFIFVFNQTNCQAYDPFGINHLYKGYNLPGLVDFGPKYGDLIMQRKDDSFLGPLPLPPNFPFFNKHIESFYININGIVSFDKELSVFDEINYPQNTSYLSVFWSDVNTKFNGNIFHREIKNKEVLKYLSTLAAKALSNNEQDKFAASWAYLITWHNVEPHRRYNELKSNTFQAVLFTNNICSFVLFNYFQLGWPNNIFKSNFQVGYNVDAATKVLLDNVEQSLFDIDKNNQILSRLVEKSNLDFERGKWLFRLDTKDDNLEQLFLKAELNKKKNSLKIKPVLNEEQLNLHLVKDKNLGNNDDGYVQVDLKCPVRFPLAIDGEYVLKKLFIHTNGLITFETAISYSGEISSESNRNKIYIAPLWSDIDTRYGGEILHGELESLNNLTGLINDIKNATNLDKNFEPVWAYVVQWINVKPYRSRNEELKNSFQAFLMTNENCSLILFDYLHLTWPSKVFFKNIQVGFNLNTNQSVLLKNFDPAIFSLSLSNAKSENILNKLRNESNFGVKGKWVFRLDLVEWGFTSQSLSSAYL